VQDTFGNNQFFWNGAAGSRNCSILDDLGGRFLDSIQRNLLFLGDHPRHRGAARHRRRAVDARDGWQVAACLVILALPLLIPWNVVGTIWQIFGRPDIGLLGYVLNKIGLNITTSPTISTPGSP